MAWPLRVAVPSIMAEVVVFQPTPSFPGIRFLDMGDSSEGDVVSNQPPVDQKDHIGKGVACSTSSPVDARSGARVF